MGLSGRFDVTTGSLCGFNERVRIRPTLVEIPSNDRRFRAGKRREPIPWCSSCGVTDSSGQSGSREALCAAGTLSEIYHTIHRSSAIGESIFVLTNPGFRHQNHSIRPTPFETSQTLRMRPIRQAFIAVFVLLAVFESSALAAHCRSGDRLVLGEWADQVAPGVFDPQRPSWEIEPTAGTIAWGMTCQDGDSSDSGRHLPGISIVSGQSIARLEAPPGVRYLVHPENSSWQSLRSAPDPKPPKAAPAEV